MIIELKAIQKKVARNEYEISLHAEKERREEGIRIKDIESSLLNGKMLEAYPEDKRGPSCLILGYSRGRPIHVVCGFSTTGWLRIITVYVPRAPKWSDPETRTGGR